jgi:DNA-binding response OmpR family regulator
MRKIRPVQKAEELQPDLILLDIGLPTLSGIEAARRIRELSPESRILFVSQESSADVVRGALAEGAKGYVVKTDARGELLTAVDAVLRGEQFVGRRFSGHDFRWSFGCASLPRPIIPAPSKDPLLEHVLAPGVEWWGFFLLWPGLAPKF